MPRKFKDAKDPKAARTDWKQQQEARSAPSRRGAGGIQSLMSRMGPGGGVGAGPGGPRVPAGNGPGGGLQGMMDHPAVAFGRQMTGGVGEAAGNAIRASVMQRLAGRGISQDGSGTWQIAGLQRPSDPGLQIRNSAIAAMDPSGEMLRRVLGAGGVPSGSPGLPSGRPSMGGLPSPGLGAGGPLPVTPTRPPIPSPGVPSSGAGAGGLRVVIPSPSAPITPGTGSVPSPGLGSGGVVPHTPPHTPIVPGLGPTPSPGLGAGGPLPVTPHPSGGLGGALPSLVPGDGGWNEAHGGMPSTPTAGGFLPQGQGVGRTTTPTGQEVDPSKYPPTGPPPAGGDIYRQPGTVPAQLPHPGPAPIPIAPPQPPPLANAAGYGGPGLAQRIQQGRPPAGPAGTPPSAGRPQLPAVSPGSVPGQSTPFNPTQMARPAPPAPRGGSFGTPGTPAMPQRQPADLGSLGATIQQTVSSRLASSQQGVRPGVSPATPGSPVGNSLDNLGDRIRAAVAGNTGSVQPAAPGAGGTNLGAATTSIMDRVRQQVAQAGVGAGAPPQAPQAPQAPQLPAIPNGTTPFPQQGAPSTTGGVAPQGGLPPIPAPGVPTPPGGAPAAVPGPAAPTSTAGGLGSYGNASIDKYDSTFLAAGKQYGVDPASLKAMMEIESGGNGDYPIDQCRSDGTGVDSCGPMQIKAIYHGGQAPTTEDQIMQAAGILADYKSANPGATDRDALFAVYFTGDDPNGTTQGSYGARFDELVGQIGAAPVAPAAAPTAVTPGGTTPVIPGSDVRIQDAPPADPGTAGAITDAGMGGVSPLIPGAAEPKSAIPGNIAAPATSPGGGFNGTVAEETGVMAPNGQPIGTDDLPSRAWADAIVPGGAANSTYGFGDDQGISMYCNYRDWSCTQHTGLDIGTGEGSAPINSTSAGTVVCYGEQSAANNPGVGCGAYTDSGGGMDGGYVDDSGTVHSSGNLSVLMPSGAVIIYGHMRSSNYGLGDQVPAGGQIGMSGENNGYHVHAEVQLPIGAGGLYQLVDPNLYYAGGYCSQGFCP